MREKAKVDSASRGRWSLGQSATEWGNKKRGHPRRVSGIQFLIQNNFRISRKFDNLFKTSNLGRNEKKKKLNDVLNSRRRTPRLRLVLSPHQRSFLSWHSEVTFTKHL